MSEFLSVIEWFDETGTQMVQRIPEEGSGALKLGSMVIVRPNQAAIFFRDGRGLDVLGTGRHMLSTVNIPILTKLLSLPWGFTSPFRAEVVFVNLKLFTDLGWGTQQPIAFRDSELGLVRLRAHGNYAIQVKEPLLFVNRLVGTMSAFRTEVIRDYFRDLILSRLTDYFGENVRTIFDLPAVYNEMSAAVKADLEDRFDSYGVALEDFFITAITPTEDVQRAIDRRSEMAAIGDLDAFLKYQAAQALGATGAGQGAGDGASTGTAGTASEAMAIGAGAGIGMMLPGMIWESLRQPQGNATGAVPGGAGAHTPGAGEGAGGVTTPEIGPGEGQPRSTAQTAPVDPATVTADPWPVGCPSCHLPIAADSRFCHHCGETLVAGEQCAVCDKRLPPEAKFCTECGTKVETLVVTCPSCQAELPEGARFCPGCGERIGNAPDRDGVADESTGQNTPYGRDTPTDRG